jgi:hypothetical protein
MASKSIQIDPNLFKVGGNKTRKASQKAMPKPLINPNVLRNKLLTRIKERKDAEQDRIEKHLKSVTRSKPPQIVNPHVGTRGLGTRSRAVQRPATSNFSNSNRFKTETNTNELEDSLDYFNELDRKQTKHHAINDQNRKREVLHKRTVKNYGATSTSPFVNLELPEEFNISQKPPEPPPLNSNTYSYNPSGSGSGSSFPMKLNYKIDNEVPHGCLKNGIKPTLKTMQTRRVQPSLPLSQNNPPNQMSREQKLLEMQQKVQQKLNQLKPPEPPTPPPSLPFQKQIINTVPFTAPTINHTPLASHNPLANQGLIKGIVATQVAAPALKSYDQQGDMQVDKIALPDSLMDIFPELDDGSRQITLQKELKEKEKIQSLLNEKIGPEPDDDKQNVSESDMRILMAGKKKQHVKKTIRHKYTIGRNIKNNTVGILIKDNNTRRKITNAQKEMKKKPMNELKKELKEHNLIKVGSTAPNDVLRATYEYAKLAGDIVNINTDTLMHNFVNSTDKN